MPRIYNKRYEEFFKTGEIKIINKEELEELLKKIKSKYPNEARSLVILMYYTGARPAEILNIAAGDIEKDGNSYLKVKTRALKNGLPRTIRLRLNAKFVKEVYNYAMARPENMWMFPHFRSKSKRSNKYINKNGTKQIKEYAYVSNGLWYHFDKWFDGEITPYFFRHSRFSSLMEQGGRSEDIMLLKGAKSMESVRPYAHMSKEKSMKIAKLIK